MNILSIHDGHNASVALLQGEEIVYAIQEERLTKVKNKGGFPHYSLNNVLDNYNLKLSNDIDKIIYTGNDGAINMKHRSDVINKYYKLFGFTELNPISDKKNKHIKRIEPLKKLGFNEEKIDYIEHHECHASSAAFGWGLNEDMLVITSDSNGDNLSATINVFDGSKLKRIDSINKHNSIARIYSLVTFFLGMVPMEHEYKIMGLAPYSLNSKNARTIANEFKNYFKFHDKFKYEIDNDIKSVLNIGPVLKRKLEFKRFDEIASGLQLFVEEFITEWISNVIDEIGIKNVALSGGMFMNVKLNKSISELKNVKNVYVFPSCGDESNIFGALYSYANSNNIRPNPIKNFYYGPSYSNEFVKQQFENYKFNHDVGIKYIDNIEKQIAKLLSKNEIVARYKNRMEFGARALGNRSILANSNNKDNVNKINDMIKNRDFWMPFAPSMIKSDRYIKNPKNIQAPYMVNSFDVNESEINNIIGAVHPYDKTCRPQDVYKDWNPDYYRLIEEYEFFTGDSVILNTSFNLHGYPIANEPIDAFHIFDNSGLSYLAIENYLIYKNL